MALGRYAEEHVRQFYQSVAILCREGGLSRSDVMSMTRQQRVDHMDALKNLLETLAPDGGRQ